MEISPYLQLLFLLHSFLFGMVLGAARDGFRLIRLLVGQLPRGKSALWYEKPLPFLGRPLRMPTASRLRRGVLTVLTFFLDLLFFVGAGCGIAVLQYSMNSGRFRMMAVVAAFLGFLLYALTLGRLVNRIWEGAVTFLRASCAILLHLLLLPLRSLGRAAASLCKKIRKKVGLLLAKRQRMRYNNKKRAELQKQAEKGFFP